MKKTFIYVILVASIGFLACTINIGDKKSENDKRNIVICLTEEGRKLKEKAVNVPKTLIEEHWLTDEEVIQFKSLLYKLLKGDWGK